MHSRVIGILILSMAVLSIQGTEIDDPWQSLRFLEGIWTGQGDGMSGVSSLTQEYAFILGGKFLQMKTRAVFEPQPKNPQGEVHEDLGIFSYDQARRLLVLRGFYVEGFVNQYRLDEVSEDGASLTFVTEQIENAPTGTKAKLIFHRIGEGEMEQSFHVAFPGQEFSCFSTNRLQRKK